MGRLTDTPAAGEGRHADRQTTGTQKLKHLPHLLQGKSDIQTDRRQGHKTEREQKQAITKSKEKEKEKKRTRMLTKKRRLVQMGPEALIAP
jgi:hypothetical protein